MSSIYGLHRSHPVPKVISLREKEYEKLCAENRKIVFHQKQQMDKVVSALPSRIVTPATFFKATMKRPIIITGITGGALTVIIVARSVLKNHKEKSSREI